MRFRFCGDLDCPDWVLAQIASLAKITSIKMKLLCAQVIKDILGQGIDYDKINKLTADAKFETGDVKACISALSFILSSAAKHSLDDESLSHEIQQLGLPKEHAIALCKLYADNYTSLQAKLQDATLRLSQLNDVQWRVNYIGSSSHLKEVDAPTAEFQLGVITVDSPHPKHHSFSMTDRKLHVLLNEMKQLYNLMETLE